MKRSVDFESDLKSIIMKQFDEAGVHYDRHADIGELTVRYMENLNRRIVPTPRQVLLSEEIHDSLGELRRKTDIENKRDTAEAWTATFFIRWLLSEGGNVNGFLSKGIEHAAGNRRKDKLLWDFGMHHFHLRKQFEATGFLITYQAHPVSQSARIVPSSLKIGSRRWHAIGFSFRRATA